MINPPVVLPPNKQWSQLNDGNLFGSLFGTRNITLTKKGQLALSKRMKSLGNSVDSTDLGLVTSIVFDGAKLANASSSLYYLITGGKIMTMGADLTGLTVDATAGSPNTTVNSDGVIWNDGLYVTYTNNLAKLVAGVWTSGLQSLTSSRPHPLAVSSLNNYLLIGNVNKLEKRTTAGTASTAITLPSQYQILWIRSSNGRTFIGTTAKDGSSAAVFDWDEVAAGANNRYDVDCTSVLSGEFLGSDFYIMTDDGRLLRFDGGGFDTDNPAAKFPIYDSIDATWTAINDYTMAQRGMRVIGGKMLFNINTLGELLNVNSGQTYSFDNFPSGIWEFNGTDSLNHKFSLSAFTAGEDFGQPQFYYSSPGAIAPLYKDPEFGYAPGVEIGREVIAGAALYKTDGSNDWIHIGSVVIGTNRGYFSTVRIESTQITNTANKIWCKFRGVTDTEDKIIFKYRVGLRDGIPFSTGQTNVTWASTTSFTFSSASGIDWSDVRDGDEVTILTGHGAGSTAHIVSSTLNATTWTIVLDEAIPNVTAGERTLVLVENWVKIETSITNADILGYKDIPIPQTTPSTWIQIKAELRGEGVIIEELQVVESTAQVVSS